VCPGQSGPLQSTQWADEDEPVAEPEPYWIEKSCDDVDEVDEVEGW